jgi:hypothetical protein
MKLTLIAALAATTISTAAVAADFDNAVVSVTASSGALAFTLEGNQANGYTNMEIRGKVLTYSMGKDVESTVDVFVGHSRVADQMTVGTGYTMVYAPNAWSFYGSAELAYVAATNDLSSGDVFVTPTAGASYVFAEKFAAFGEVSYAWNVSNSLAATGGSVELGIDYAITPTWTVTPSLVRTFNTGADDTQLHIATRFAF